MTTRQIAIDIVNHLNSEFNLELKTVDASAMTDDVNKIISNGFRELLQKKAKETELRTQWNVEGADKLDEALREKDALTIVLKLLNYQ